MANNPNKKMNDLEKLIHQWATDKGIFANSIPIKQALKTQEEVTELLNAIVDKDQYEVKDAIGDICRYCHHTGTHAWLQPTGLPTVCL